MAPPSPPRIRPRGLKKVKTRQPKVSECDDCMVCGCRQEDLHRRDETLAWSNDKPKPECSDRVAPYWEAVNS